MAEGVPDELAGTYAGRAVSVNYHPGRYAACRNIIGSEMSRGIVGLSKFTIASYLGTATVTNILLRPNSSFFRSS